jgi:hypothetical protein
LREVVCPVLELREEKRTFVKVEGGKVDFFLKKKKEKDGYLWPDLEAGL